MEGFVGKSVLVVYGQAERQLNGVGWPWQQQHCWALCMWLQKTTSEDLVRRLHVSSVSSAVAASVVTASLAAASVAAVLVGSSSTGNEVEHPGPLSISDNVRSTSICRPSPPYSPLQTITDVDLEKQKLTLCNVTERGLPIADEIQLDAKIISALTIDANQNGSVG